MSEQPTTPTIDPPPACPFLPALHPSEMTFAEVATLVDQLLRDEGSEEDPGRIATVLLRIQSQPDPDAFARAEGWWWLHDHLLTAVQRRTFHRVCHRPPQPQMNLPGYDQHAVYLGSHGMFPQLGLAPSKIEALAQALVTIERAGGTWLHTYSGRPHAENCTLVDGVWWLVGNGSNLIRADAWERLHALSLHLAWGNAFLGNPHKLTAEQLRPVLERPSLGDARIARWTDTDAVFRADIPDVPTALRLPATLAFAFRDCHWTAACVPAQTQAGDLVENDGTPNALIARDDHGIAAVLLVLASPADEPEADTAP